MYAVAITRLGSELEAEARALGSDLGTQPYEERLKLAAGLPAVVLLTPDATRAAALDRSLQARGHDTVLCPIAEVVRAAAMVSLRRFRFADHALITSVGAGADAELAWNDVLALVRATDRRRHETTTTVKEKKFDMARTLATGGLIRSRSTQREVTSSVDASAQVLYLFRRSGQTPWILHEEGTKYAGLGAQLTHSTSANFAATVEQLRARATGAHYDDRLVARRRPHQPAGAAKVSSPHDLDLLAHLIATSIARRDLGRY